MLSRFLDIFTFFEELPITIFAGLIDLLIYFAALIGFDQFADNVLQPFYDALLPYTWLVPIFGLTAAAFFWLGAVALIRLIRWLLALIPFVNL